MIRIIFAPNCCSKNLPKWFHKGKSIWTFVFVFLHFLCLRAQIFEDKVFKDLAMNSMDLIYLQAHDQAEAALNQMVGLYPSHPAPHFLLATNRWWQSYISTTTAYHEYIKKELQTALNLNKNLANQEGMRLEYTFFQYMCYAFQTRLHTLRREWIKAANIGRKTLPFIEECIQLAEGHSEFYFSAGIYHYYAEAYPDEHPYIKPLMHFFPDGGASQGLEEMEKAASIPNFAQVEAQFYLTDIYIFWEKDFPKAIQNSKALHERYPTNTWFFAEYIRALVHGGKYEEAMQELNGIIKLFEQMDGHDSRHIPSTESTLTSKLMIRLYHYYGRALFYGKNDIGKAIEALKSSLKQAELSKIKAWEYIAHDHLLLGICYDKLGLRSSALIQYKKALQTEDNDLYKDKIKECIDSPCYE